MPCVVGTRVSQAFVFLLHICGAVLIISIDKHFISEEILGSESEGTRKGQTGGLDSAFKSRKNRWLATGEGPWTSCKRYVLVQSALAFAPSVFSSSAPGLPPLKRSSRAPRFYAVLSQQVYTHVLLTVSIFHWSPLTTAQY